MPQNIYKKAAQDKVKLGRTLTDITQIQKYGEMDVKEVTARGATIQSAFDSLAYGKNIYDSHKRISDEVKEAEDWASKQTYISDRSGKDMQRYEAYVDPDATWIDEKKTLYKDTKTGDIESIGDLISYKAEDKARKRKGLDEPFEQPDVYGKDEMDDFFSMGKSHSEFQKKSVQYAASNPTKKDGSPNIVTESSINKMISEYSKTNKADYSLDKKTLVGKGFDQDFTKILSDWDSIFGLPKKTVQEEVIDGDESNILRSSGMGGRIIK